MRGVDAAPAAPPREASATPDVATRPARTSVRDAAGRLVSDAVLLYRLGWAGLRDARAFARFARNRHRQPFPTLPFPDGGAVASIDELERRLVERDLAYGRGTHTLYLPPDTARRLGFQVGPLLPADHGVKLVRNADGSGRGASYSRPGLRIQSPMVRALADDPRMVFEAGAFLARFGLAPFHHGLGVVGLSDGPHAAIVVEHIAGRVATDAERRAAIERLEALAAEGLVRFVAPWGRPWVPLSLEPTNWVLDERTGGACLVDAQYVVLTKRGAAAAGAPPAKHA